MELVAAKAVLLSSGGFFLCGGFALFKALDDFRRSGALQTFLLSESSPALASQLAAPGRLLTAQLNSPVTILTHSWKQKLFDQATSAPLLHRTVVVALVEGSRTARALALGALTAGTVTLYKYGAHRYDLVLDMRYDATGAAFGITIGTYAALARSTPLLSRAAAGAAAGAVFLAAIGLATWEGENRKRNSDADS